MEYRQSSASRRPPDGMNVAPNDRKSAVAIVAIVARRGDDARILVTRRPEGVHLGGFWELPGGKIEPGESPVDAACREVREEVGVTLATAQYIAAVDHEYVDRHVRLHLFGSCLDSTPAISPTCGEHRWITPSELALTEFPPANMRLLPALLAWCGRARH